MLNTSLHPKCLIFWARTIFCINSCRGHFEKKGNFKQHQHQRLFQSLMCNFFLAKKEFLLEITELVSCSIKIYLMANLIGLRRLSSLEQNIRSKLALILSKNHCILLGKVSYSFLINSTTFQNLIFVYGFINVVIIYILKKF